jgi:hypothetical protein
MQAEKLRHLIFWSRTGSWFGRFQLVMKKIGYEQSNAYHMLFHKRQNDKLTTHYLCKWYDYHK